MKKFCERPFFWFEPGITGDTYSCCPSWLGKKIGNINNDSVEDVWNSESAKEIRSSILDGSFRFCNKKICPFITGNMLRDKNDPNLSEEIKNIIENNIVDGSRLPRDINFSYDESCNLSCPSCRNKPVIHRDGIEFEKRLKIHNKIINTCFKDPTNKSFLVNITGSGDPFASKLFRSFLFNIDGDDFPNLKIQLQTNGNLLTEKIWNKMESIHTNIFFIMLSIDAGLEKSYNVIRRGGNWKNLWKNISMLNDIKKNSYYDFIFRLDFVVQKGNYKEIAYIINHVFETYENVNSINLSGIQNWYHMSDKYYLENAVHLSEHKEHENLVNILNFDSVQKYKDRINFNDLSNLIQGE